jgi:putative Holliday junction resolvase
MTDRNPAPPLSPAEMKAALPRHGKLLGLDLGTKTIGLAASDGLGLSATPLHTIRRTKFTRDAAELLSIVEANEIKGLVIGLPVEMDGTEGKRCQSTRQFAANLRGLDGPLAALPLAFWDERLSTAAVQRMMIDEMDLSRKKRAQTVDKAAAAYILQGFLDAMARA